VSRDVELSPNRYLYGLKARNDELSGKAAAQELLAGLQLANCFHDQFIVVPLQTIIDFKGKIIFDLDGNDLF
jgi:hypothetical protein